MRVRTVFLTAIALLLATAIAANADDWPNKPVRILIPLTAGSAVDIVPRIVFEEVGAALGQPFIIENRPGASGAIAARAAATSAPDGYTLLVHSSAMTITPYMITNAGYDPVTDFVPVASLGVVPNVLVVSPAKGFRTLPALAAAARERPMNFGTIGVGSPMQLAMARLQESAGFQAQNITFRGAPEALTETMTGRIDFYYAPISSALEFVRSNKLLALAVSSRTRAASLPEVPTTLESGYPDSDYTFWIGAFAPAGTPSDIVGQLDGAIAAALRKPSVVEKLKLLGVDPALMSRPQFAQYVRDEVASSAALSKKLGLGPN